VGETAKIFRGFLRENFRKFCIFEEMKFYFTGNPFLNPSKFSQIENQKKARARDYQAHIYMIPSTNFGI